VQSEINKKHFWGLPDRFVWGLQIYIPSPFLISSLRICYLLKYFHRVLISVGQMSITRGVFLQMTVGSRIANEFSTLETRN